MIVVNGTNMQANPTIRHGNNVFSKYTIDTPKDVPRFVYPIKIPRMEGSLERLESKKNITLHFALNQTNFSVEMESNGKIHNFQKKKCFKLTKLLRPKRMQIWKKKIYLKIK